MPYITIGARRHALEPGETTIGGEGAGLPLPGAPDGAPLAAIVRAPDDRVLVRALRPDAGLLVNGVAVTGEPHQLAHGAKLQLLGRTLHFGDARRSAGTERVAGLGDDRLAALDAALPAMAAGSGGRLVSVADGREWPVPDEGLEIGRDPACDVVVDSPDASRWHATIERTLLGYVVRDTSSNGVLVNGARVDEARPLAAGDVLRIGAVELRFEADPAPPDPLPPAQANDERLPREPVGGPSGSGAPRPLLATLEILNQGTSRGERIRIEHAAARIGRSSRADVVFGDESVSAVHATLARRDGAWVVTDHDSTNGTYVDGDRIRGERRLTGAAELRFGNVKTLFRPIAAASATAPDPPTSPAGDGGDTKGTRGIVGV